MAKVPDATAQLGVAVTNEGELPELIDRPSSGLRTEPPSKRPATDHRNDLRVDQLRSVGFAD